MKLSPKVLALPLLLWTGTADVLSAQTLAPDLVYHGGTVLTFDGGSTVAEAVAVRDGRVAAVGTDAGVLGLAGPATRVVDLSGRTLLPGFYDNHIHLGGELQEWRGALISAIPEWLREVDTLEELQEAVRSQAATTPAGSWIRGELAREDWPNQKIPTRQDLDAAAPDHPVALTRGPHTIILNSRAFEIAGITAATPDPPGGWIIRDTQGVPSGRLLETAKRLVDPHLSPASANPSDIVETWRRQLVQLRGLGITSVNMAGLRPAQLRLAQTLYERHGEELPRMTVQIRLSPGYDTYDDPVLGARESIRELESLGFRTGFGNERLKVGAIKMSIDGGLSAPVLWTLASYPSRPDFHGVQRIPAETFYDVARRAHDLGWQLGIHTIGDAAAVMVVDELERILRESPRHDHRHFLHHVTVKPPAETIRKMAALQLMVATHPSWTTALGGFAAEALDAERLETQNPSRSLLDAGVRLSYGSDAAPYGPLFNVWNAVTRRGWGDRVYGANEAVTVDEAIRLHTMGSAYMTFDEAERGSIEVGKLADFVVLERNPLEVAPAELWSIPVVETVIGGVRF